MTVLFGVSFASELEFSVVRDGTEVPFELVLHTKPSKELLKHIASLSRGMSIAVDDYSPDVVPTLPRVINGMQIDPQNNSAYYRSIYHMCSEQGIRRIFLETPESYRLLGTLHTKNMCLEAQLGSLTQDDPPYRWDILSTERYATTVECNRASTVLFEQKVIDVVRTQHPDVMIISDPHANHLFFTNRDLFTAYHREQAPPAALLKRKITELMLVGCGPIQAEQSLRDNMIANKFVRDAQRIEDVFTHDIVQRKFRALKYRRLTNGTPDFIGEWGDIPGLGVIEFYVKDVDGELVRGIAEDVYATTPFFGKISPKSVEFTRFLRGDDGEDKEIFYYAEKEGDVYVGMFQHPEVEGKFSLRPFKSHEC